MSDTGEKKTLSLGTPGARLGSVKPNLSSGRAKRVVVETRDGKRVVATPATSPATAFKARPSPVATATPAAVTPEEPAKRPAGASAAEIERRTRALAAARAREAEEVAQRGVDEAAREEERQRRRAEIEAREREEAARAEEARSKIEDEVQTATTSPFPEDVRM